jgi:hypothetical protein
MTSRVAGLNLLLSEILFATGVPDCFLGKNLSNGCA